MKKTTLQLTLFIGIILMSVGTPAFAATKTHIKKHTSNTGTQVIVPPSSTSAASLSEAQGSTELQSTSTTTSHEYAAAVLGVTLGSLDSNQPGAPVYSLSNKLTLLQTQVYTVLILLLVVLGIFLISELDIVEASALLRQVFTGPQSRRALQ